MALQTSQSESLIPPQPLVPCAQVFTSRIHGLLDGRPKDQATVEQALTGLEGVFDLIVAKMYTLASMLVGEGEESILLVEATIAHAELAAGNNPEQSRRNSRLALCTAAIQLLERRSPGCLAAPAETEKPSKCIEGDDLDSSGVSGAELQDAIGGRRRAEVRVWLASLPAALRTIFALRAVAGFSPAETAELLRENGGAQASEWTEDAVRIWFRRALCSLATQVLRASAA